MALVFDNGKPYLLCWDCATERGIARTFEPHTLLGTQYQLDKFVKHTVVDPTHKLQSVFNDSSVTGYQNWVVNSVASGCVAFDGNGKHSFIFAAGRDLGVTYKKGSFHTKGDAIKVVLPDDMQKAHAYPMSSQPLAPVSCAQCGAPVIS